MISLPSDKLRMPVLHLELHLVIVMTSCFGCISILTAAQSVSSLEVARPDNEHVIGLTFIIYTQTVLHSKV